MGKTITGSSTIGVTLTSAKTTLDGTIVTASEAIYGSAAQTWKLTNLGTAASTESDAIVLLGPADLTNKAGALISGRYEAMFVGGPAHISNAGTILSTSAFSTALELNGGYAVGDAPKSKFNTIVNAASGLIIGGTGIFANGTSTIINQGHVTGTSTYGSGILFIDGTVENAKGGTITGGEGVVLAASGTIVNAGLIVATGAAGHAIGLGISTGNELLLEAGSTLIGNVYNFLAGDTIDEAGLTITGETFANGVLTLTNGKSIVTTLAIDENLNSGGIVLKTDGKGGTDILLGTETFSGTYGHGIELAALSNTVAAGTTITGSISAVYGDPYRNWTLVNRGSLIASGNSVEFFGSAYISNASAGLIQGSLGIELGGGTLVNAGTITGTDGTAIDLVSSGAGVDIVLKSGSTLRGAIQYFSTGDTVDLAGITATKEVFGNGILTLTNAGAVVDTIAFGGLLNTGAFALGTATGGGTDISIGPSEIITGHYGIALDLAAKFTSLTSTASIGNAGDAVFGEGLTQWTLVNAGTIAAGDFGVALNSGTVSNAAHGIITGHLGVDVSNSSLTNAGTITGIGAYSYGIEALGTGTARNLASGTISADATGADIGGTLTNAGSIFAETGVRLSGTLTNSGTLLGRGGNIYYTYLDTGLFQSSGLASNTGLIAGPTGAKISGGILINAGLIEGLPGGYREGLYGGAQTVASAGITISNTAAVTNTATGTISGAYGVVLAGGIFTDAGTVASTLSAGAAIAFGTADATLILDQGNVIDGAIAGFLSGDVIDFAATSITSEKFAGGIITLLNGTAIVEKLSLTGFLNQKDFTLVPEGSLGTELIIGQEIFSGSYSSGITLSAPTTITKTGTIAASGPAIYGSAARDWTLLNQGLIIATLATYDDGVFLKSSALVTNAATGTIEAQFIGLNAGGYIGHATLINQGTILSTGPGFNAAGVYLAGDSTVTNTGLIAGKTGLNIGAGSTVTNAGTIATNVTGGNAIKLTGQGTTDITLDAGAKIIGAIAGFAGADVIDFANQTFTTDSFSNGTLSLFDNGVSLASLLFAGSENQSEFTLTSDNAGGTKLILGPEILTGTYQYGITLTATRTTIAAGALIEVLAGHAGPGNPSGYALVDLTGTGATITNNGRVIDTYYGKSGAFVGGDTFINNAGATLSGSAGIKLEGQAHAPASLSNAGTIIGIRAGGYGLDLTYGFVTNAKNGLVTGDSGLFIYNAIATNSGLIQANKYDGIDVFGGYGDITNKAGGTITGGIGIIFNNTGTVANAGTIIGTAGTAIEFGAYAARFIDDPGATLIGGVTAAGTAAHVLELASAATAGTLAGIGETITGFATITFDPGAAFTLAGDTAGIAAGQTIEDFSSADSLVLDNFSASSFSTIAHSLVLKNAGNTITLDISTTLAGTFAIHATGNTTTITAAAASGGVITAGALATAPMAFLHPSPWVSNAVTLPALQAAPRPQPQAATKPAATVAGWLQLHPSPQPQAIPAVTLHPG